jgi:hypothetical protein
MVVSSKRGPRAAQEQAAELSAFVKAFPGSRNVFRVLAYLRAVYKDAGEADPAAKAVALAKEARCAPAVIERLSARAEQDEKGTGLEGEYHDNKDLANLKFTRVDPVINFDWSNKPPHPSMRNETFSVRWTGQAKPLYSEAYTFYTVSDDGVRLWVDDKLLVDNWTDHPAVENTGTLTLIGGTKYDIKLEYFQGSGLAVIGLGWSSATQKKEIIPQTCLFPPFAGGDNAKAPVDPKKQQAGYREAARLLPDAPDGWMLLQVALAAYPADAHADRIRECEAYLKDFPETVNAVTMLTTLKQLYAQVGRSAPAECEQLMAACKLPRDARRAFYAQQTPAWTEWHVLGPVQASGEGRGMEQVMQPERGVDLAWKAQGPLEIPLAWTKIARKKEDPEYAAVDLYRWLVEKLDAQKKAEIEREPYFAYAYRRIAVPSQRRATLFFGVNDTISIWINGKRVVTQSSPGAGKDCQAVEVPLREGDNEVLLKAGAPSGRLCFFFRIADTNGRPFDDLPKE